MQIVLIGDSGVGKSSLLQQFTENKFSPKFITTIGLDFRPMKLTINGELNVPVKIWDTAGQERFRSITKSYYRNAHGIIIVFDVTDKISFAHVKHWLSEIEKSMDTTDTEFLLVGNKCDLSDKRVIDFETASTFAEEHRLRYVESSALLGTNIHQPFVQLIERVHTKLVPKPVKQTTNITETEKSWTCCSS